jgi:hypothetical protein
MKDEESGQSAELNSYHGDIDPSFGAGFSGFVIADQSALAHQPAEGAFHHPAAWQDFKPIFPRLTSQAEVIDLQWSRINKGFPLCQTNEKQRIQRVQAKSRLCG